MKKYPLSPMTAFRQSKIDRIMLVILLLLTVPGTCFGEELLLQAVGDLMLGGRWEAQMARDGYRYPFARLAGELRKGDLTLANLEAPLTRRGEEYRDKRFRFRVDPAAAAALRWAGITTVTLANNHSMDFGMTGLRDTIACLDKAGIGWCGAGADLAEAGQVRFFALKGKTVALLAVSLTLPEQFWATQRSGGTMPLQERRLREAITAARRQADIVLVTVHWGEEGTARLRPCQPRLARMMIDSGADVVIGHHPHVVQGVERYGRGLIFYSLGNFVFATKSRLNGHGLMIRLRLNGKLRSAELLPIATAYRDVGFQPRLMYGAEAELALEQVRRISPGLVLRRENGTYLVDF